MRIVLSSMVLALVFVLAPVSGQEGECDMKTVEKAFYCEEHELLMPTELVSDVVYYECAECGVIEKTPGECEYCGEALKKMTSGKGVCPHCFQKPAEAEACVKTFYECEDCGHRSMSPGKCESCDTTLVKKVSRAVIEYVCPECGFTQMKPGACTDEECEHHGKALVRHCSMSGEYPHVKGAK